MIKAFLLLLVAFAFSCNQDPKQEISPDLVIAKFKENSGRIEKMEYQAQRIDSFTSGTVWNNTGHALIEKDKADKIFGFAFYAKRDDVPYEYIYDQGLAFELSQEKQTYKTEKGQSGILGNPGGQMILRNAFKLDTVYKSVTLEETTDTFILHFAYEDKPLYNASKIFKTVELEKERFLPVRFSETATSVDGRYAGHLLLSNLKTNEQVRNSIADHKSEISNLDLVQPEKRTPSRMLNKKLSPRTLPDLVDREKPVSLNREKLVLIDFWEYWCGPCLASFPKVEDLKNRYPEELVVIGIVSDKPENARKIVEQKKTSFLNLVGNDAVKEEFGVNSYPRYFLIDQAGIVKKEYFGFSDDIEEDIKKLIKA